jgi:hypothetical protein
VSLTVVTRSYARVGDLVRAHREDVTMTTVKLTIEISPSAIMYVEVSSVKAYHPYELGSEVIDILRRHYPMSATQLRSAPGYSTRGVSEAEQPLLRRAARWGGWGR